MMTQDNLKVVRVLKLGGWVEKSRRGIIIFSKGLKHSHLPFAEINNKIFLQFASVESQKL